MKQSIPLYNSHPLSLQNTHVLTFSISLSDSVYLSLLLLEYTNHYDFFIKFT